MEIHHLTVKTKVVYPQLQVWVPLFHTQIVSKSINNGHNKKVKLKYKYLNTKITDNKKYDLLLAQVNFLRFQLHLNYVSLL